MGDGRRAPGVFHFRPLRCHAEPFVKVGVKHLDALLVERADQFLTLVPFVVLAGIERFTPAANHEDVRLVASPRVDQSAPEPRSAGKLRPRIAADGQRHLQNRANGQRPCHASHKIPTLHLGLRLLSVRVAHPASGATAVYTPDGRSEPQFNT